MNTHSNRRPVYRGFVVTLSLAASLAFLTDCARTAFLRQPGPPLGPPPDSISCEGKNDCLESQWFPECAYDDATICHVIDPSTSTSDRECLFIVDNDKPGCLCVEREVRICTLTPTTKGVKRCQRVAADTTAWTACAAP